MKKILSIIGIIFITVTANLIYSNYSLNKENSEYIELLSSELEVLNSDKQIIMELLDIIESKILDYKATISGLEYEKELNIVVIENLNKQIDALNKENTTLKEQLAKNDEIITNLNNTITRLEKENSDLKIEIYNLQQLLASYKAQLDAANERIKELEAQSCGCETVNDFSKNVLNGDVYKYNMTPPPGTNTSGTTPVGGGFRVVFRNGGGNGNKYVFIFHSSQVYGSYIRLMSGSNELSRVTYNFEKNSMYLVTFTTNTNLATNGFYLKDSGDRNLYSVNTIYTWSWEQIYGSIKYNAFVFY